MNYQDPDLNIAAIGFFILTLPPHIFQKVFKNEYGISLFDFIHKYRISKAKDLMSKSGNSIADIALAVGYAQIRTFNRIFKKYEGMTPSEFRTNPK
ncbi:MAG: helix-turn-helix transcriptional regulator [Clostridiales bacterium]|nr:MAG: helix-turn-helix transcriptional regulator [Clostridiales bacterium]